MFLKPLGIPTGVRLVGISVQASHERLLEPQVRELYVFHCLRVVAILFDCNENFPLYSADARVRVYALGYGCCQQVSRFYLKFLLTTQSSKHQPSSSPWISIDGMEAPVSRSDRPRETMWTLS